MQLCWQSQTHLQVFSSNQTISAYESVNKQMADSLGFNI